MQISQLCFSHCWPWSPYGKAAQSGALGFIQAAFTANQMLRMGTENPTEDSVCLQVHTLFLETISFYFQTVKTCECFSASAYSASRWMLVLSISGSEMGRAHGQVCLEGDQSEQAAKQAENCISKEIAGLFQGESKACGSVPACAGGNLCLHGGIESWCFCCAGILSVLLWTFSHPWSLSVSFPAPDKVLVTFLS